MQYKGVFTHPLDIRYSTEGSLYLKSDYWVVLNDFKYYIDENTWVSVPKGYLTDGASVPSIFWPIVPRWGHHGQAVVLHDILCETLSVTHKGKPYDITREICDNILHRSMLDLRVHPDIIDRIMFGVNSYRRIMNVHAKRVLPNKRKVEAELYNSTQGYK